MSARPTRIILDTSAIIAFTRGSVDVGEVIGEVNDERCAAGLPLLCLVHAKPFVTDDDLLDLLVAHPATTIVCPDADSWRGLAAAQHTVGRLDAASAVVAALKSGSSILTSQPGLYAGWAAGGEGLIIPFS